jgi:hypothetical protein
VSGVLIAYNPLAEPAWVNPSETFTIVKETVGTSVTTQSGSSSARRYSFENTEDRVLGHVIGSGVNIAQGTLEVWRNMAQKGDVTPVRGQPRGWGFQDPYYKTTVYVDKSGGADIDFGGKAVIIDGASQTGKVNVSKGRHALQVHKNNWKLIDKSTVTDLATLKTADPLYPYNHRYLVEGFEYPSGYPSTEPKIYRGFDIVAEHFMKEVSPFDLKKNVKATDYSKFARDADAADNNGMLDGAAASIPSSSVFLLKVDEANPDFVNEVFLLKFKSAKTLYKFLRLKAILSTTDTEITPRLDSYRIKISS